MASSDPEKIALGDAQQETMREFLGRTAKMPSGNGDTQVTAGDGEDILALQDLDPVLNMKMHLVNNVRTTPKVEGVKGVRGFIVHAYNGSLNIYRLSTKLAGRTITGSCSYSMDSGKHASPSPTNHSPGHSVAPA